MSNPKETKNKIGTSVSGKLMTINYVSILSGVALNFKGIVDVDHWKYIYIYIYIYMAFPDKSRPRHCKQREVRRGAVLQGGTSKTFDDNVVL